MHSSNMCLRIVFGPLYVTCDCFYLLSFEKKINEIEEGFIPKK